jgi:hypothetical protein
MNIFSGKQKRWNEREMRRKGDREKRHKGSNAQGLNGEKEKGAWSVESGRKDIRSQGHEGARA